MVPRSLEKSLLFQVITSKDKDAQMPPKGWLPDAVIADLRRWIEMGAPNPRTAQPVAATPVKTAVDVEKGRSFWSYQPLTKPSPPVVSGATWARTDMDRFVQAGLEAKRFKPVGDADAAVLVRTVDDFGATGEAPSHPALLDFLAARLIENQWSIKALIREIALWRAWQLSSEFSEAQFATDPDNRLLWRANKRRRDAESMRDAVLWVSGQLDRARPLGTPLVEAGEGTVGQNVFEPVNRGLDSNHRSVYLPRVRNVMPEMIDLFDAPDASTVSGARSATSSPLQALFMMNNTSLAKQSAAFADRIAAQAGPRQIEFAWVAALGRPPTAREWELAVKFIEKPGSGESTERHRRARAIAVLHRRVQHH